MGLSTDFTCGSNLPSLIIPMLTSTVMRDLTFLVVLLIWLRCSKANEGEDKIVHKKHTSDDKINEKIERYLELLQKKKTSIEKFLTDNYSDFNHSDFTPEEYVSHPINAYMLMKRTSVIWQMAKPAILDTSSDELWKEIEQDMKNLQ